MKIRLFLLISVVPCLAAASVLCEDKTKKPTPPATEPKVDKKEGKGDKSPPPTKKEISAWIRALKSKDAEEVEQAQKKLVEAGRPAAKTIASQFKLFNKVKRLNALKVLAEMPQKEARLQLAKCAYNDKYKEVRLAAAKALSESRSRTAFNYILRKAFAEEEKYRKKAARAIANIGDKETIGVLIAATEDYFRHLAAEEKARKKSTKMKFQTGGVSYDTGQPKKKKQKLLALELLLGKYYNKDMKKVKTWWQSHKENYKFPDLEK